MKSFVITLFFLFFLSAGYLYGQAPAIEWQKCLGGNNGEYAFSIEPTTDGGYIVGGYTEGLNNGDIMGFHGNNQSINDYLIFKLDATGAIQWQKCLGGIYTETAAFIHQTADGGYIVAGSSNSVDCNIKSHNSLDYWIVKLDGNGETQWQKSYGGSKNEYAWGISLTNDGGYVVTGDTESNDGDVTGNHGARDFWIIKIDGSGNLIWQKTLGGSGDDGSKSVEATADGGCIVTGTTESNDGDVSGNHGTRDYWVVKLSSTGSLQWQKCYGGSYFDEPWSIKLTQDGGYIVAGYSSSNDGDVTGNHWSLAPHFSDYWVVKLDVNGNLQWQKCYGGDKNEIAYYIKPTADGGYVVAGSAESDNGDATCNAGITTDAWIIKINSAGMLEWQKSMGGNLYEEAYCIAPLPDGSYIFCGSTCSKDVSGYHPSTNMGSCADFWIVKLASPLAVTTNPVVTINPATGIVCPGATATFTASALYAGTFPLYQWTVNGAAAGTNSSTFTSSTLSANDKIVCTVTSGGTCETSSSKSNNTVIIQTANNVITPSINITADNTIICDCTPVNFKASITNAGGSPYYDWKVNGISTGNIRNAFTSNTLIDGDIISCVYTDNATCVAGGSVTSNTIKVQRATNQLPVVSIATPTDTICNGGTAIFTATAQNAGANPTYQWQVNGVSSGTGTNVFTASSLSNHDKISCVIKTDPLFVCTQAVNASSNVIDIVVQDKLNPVITIATANTTTCTGAQVTFTAITKNAGVNPFYQWKINGINASSGSNVFTTAAIQNNDIISCDITTDPLYTCTLSTSAVSNSIVMQTATGVIPSVNITASLNEICAGDPVSFTAVVLNAGSLPTYNWKVNDLPEGTHSSVYSSSSLKSGDEIKCVVYPGAGACSAEPVSSNVIVPAIDNPPVITIIPADTIVVAGSQVQLQAIIAGAVSSYTWTPSDKLENAYSLNPNTIHLTSTVSYTLMVLNDKGCKSAAISIVKVFRDLHMPNAFTPNHDQRNDVFRIPPDVSLVLNEFSIYDRWGKRLFTTKDISKGWDGMLNGKLADAGMYVYIIKGAGYSKNSVLLKGSFVLIK